MTKKFWKDNRGQMIYAVVVAIMFLSVLSMIAMGLSLQHYHAAVQKQENIANYYKVDAAAELIRKGEYDPTKQEDIDLIQSQWGCTIETNEDAITLRCNNVSITFTTQTLPPLEGEESGKTVFTSWEVSYNASND